MGYPSPTMPALEAPEFDAEAIYFVGVWQRTAFDVAAWPMCLNANNGSAACLGGYDADAGNMWRLIHCQANQYILECLDCGLNRYLGADLQMKSAKEEAEVWHANGTHKYRGAPQDKAVRFSNDAGQLLCSKNKTRQIALLMPQEADVKGEDGEFEWNSAWECSCDEESKSEDEFLSRYMHVPRFE